MGIMNRIIADGRPQRSKQTIAEAVEIPNDLKKVDEAIREYYGLNRKEGD
jgi:hypothetical protein